MKHITSAEIPWLDLSHRSTTLNIKGDWEQLPSCIPRGKKGEYIFGDCLAVSATVLSLCNFFLNEVTMAHYKNHTDINSEPGFSISETWVVWH